MRYALNKYKFSADDFVAYHIPEHCNEPFSKALTKLFRASPITQNELGKALHVSGATVSNYLHGYRLNPTKEFILEVSELFDIKPSYFREYRIMQLNDKLCEYPELIDCFLDLADDSKRVIKEYKQVINPCNLPSLKEIDEEMKRMFPNKKEMRKAIREINK